MKKLATAILTHEPDLLSFFTMAPPSILQLSKFKNLGIILWSFLSPPLLHSSISKYSSSAFYVLRAILDTEKDYSFVVMENFLVFLRTNLTNTKNKTAK